MNTFEIIQSVEKEYHPKRRIPHFTPGDVVKVNVKIKEGDKERVQVFEGVVIGRSGNASRETVTVRRISSGIGVERTFLLHSPMLESFQVVKRGNAGRAKLYYLRAKTGKHAKIKQMRRDKILQIQETERKTMAAEQEASALQAAAEASAREAAEKNPVSPQA